MLFCRYFSWFVISSQTGIMLDSTPDLGITFNFQSLNHDYYLSSFSKASKVSQNPTSFIFLIKLIFTYIKKSYCI